MNSSAFEFETDALQPIKAWCTATEVNVSLADGRTISAPIWWYPFLDQLTAAQRNAIELMYEGIWWTAADEGVSVKSILLGRQMPSARRPRDAA